MAAHNKYDEDFKKWSSVKLTENFFEKISFIMLNFYLSIAAYSNCFHKHLVINIHRSCGFRLQTNSNFLCRGRVWETSIHSRKSASQTGPFRAAAMQFQGFAKQTSSAAPSWEVSLFPNWNPQAEFISAEEKSVFQGFAAQILHEEIGLSPSVPTRRNPDFDEGR